MEQLKKDFRSWLWVLALLLLLCMGPWPASAADLPQPPQAGSLLWRMQNGYTTAT